VTTWLLVAHIAVLGYWLGAELVINSTYRYVCYSVEDPFEARDRLMDHVMHVDQHVRYALVLQATLGTLLAMQLGYLPGGTSAQAWVILLGGGWLALVELVHRRRARPVGEMLAWADRMLRALLIALLIAFAAGLFEAGAYLPGWFRWKLTAFAGVMACGVAIRLVLLRHFATWREMATNGASPVLDRQVQRLYWRATGVLLLLWGLIALMTFLSVAKPA